MNAQPAADVRSDVETKEGKMKKAILATKVGMTQIFQEDGTLKKLSEQFLGKDFSRELTLEEIQN